MKQTKFSEEQIAMALHLAEQTSVEVAMQMLEVLNVPKILQSKML